MNGGLLLINGEVAHGVSVEFRPSRATAPYVPRGTIKASGEIVLTRPRFAAPAYVPPSLTLTGWRPPEVGWRMGTGADR